MSAAGSIASSLYRRPVCRHVSNWRFLTLYIKNNDSGGGKKKLKCHSLSNEISFQSTDNKTKYNLTFEKGVVSLQRNKHRAL